MFYNFAFCHIMFYNFAKFDWVARMMQRCKYAIFENIFKVISSRCKFENDSYSKRFNTFPGNNL